MSPGRALTGKDAATAPGERQQHACPNEVVRNATLHARKNASSFFNGVSTLAGGDFVKDKDSLPPVRIGPSLPRITVLSWRQAFRLKVAEFTVEVQSPHRPFD
jgi:hypothetical protein